DRLVRHAAESGADGRLGRRTADGAHHESGLWVPRESTDRDGRKPLDRRELIARDAVDAGGNPKRQTAKRQKNPTSQHAIGAAWSDLRHSTSNPAGEPYVAGRFILNFPLQRTRASRVSTVSQDIAEEVVDQRLLVPQGIIAVDRCRPPGEGRVAQPA